MLDAPIHLETHLSADSPDSNRRDEHIDTGSILLWTYIEDLRNHEWTRIHPALRPLTLQQ